MTEDVALTDATHHHSPAVVPAFPEEAFVAAAGLFRSAGDHERLRLLAVLVDGERCVTELAETVEAGLSTVSQRLRVLRTEGLLVRRREGKHMYYALADRHIAELITNALAHASEDHQHDREDRADEPGVSK